MVLLLLVLVGSEMAFRLFTFVLNGFSDTRVNFLLWSQTECMTLLPLRRSLRQQQHHFQISLISFLERVKSLAEKQDSDLDSCRVLRMLFIIHRQQQRPRLPPSATTSWSNIFPFSFISCLLWAIVTNHESCSATTLLWPLNAAAASGTRSVGRWAKWQTAASVEHRRMRRMNSSCCPLADNTETYYTIKRSSSSRWTIADRG